jgi:hypothetical protein
MDSDHGIKLRIVSSLFCVWRSEQNSFWTLDLLPCIIEMVGKYLLGYTRRGYFKIIDNLCQTVAGMSDVPAFLLVGGTRSIY